ncbi:hypothetical protein [Flaviflagellibacter deserti]|uniref:DUF4375 domain-containing protein n=1 Tax=Flaviflagellibacter deserti TaxID=2267266 RepID=A0ABV9Z1N3_9HYPH
MRLIATLLAFAILAGTAAHAQTETNASVVETAPLPDVQPVQIQLSPDMVRRYVESLPDTIVLAREFDAKEKAPPASTNLDDIPFLLVPYLFDPEAERRINAVLARFGFGNYAAWANAAYSIALAAESVNFGRVEDLTSQKGAAEREIRADKTLSDEDKKKAIEDLDAQFAALAEFEPLPGNREAVQPFLQRLRSATGG